ncbi:MAG: glucose-6-phosphate isomerase, partial [Kiloniellales bacterium]
MLYRQGIEDCLSAALGAGGFDARALDKRLAASEAGLATLRDWHATKRLPLLTLPGRSDDLAELERIAADWRRRFAEVVVLGTGGSALGARTLLALASPDRTPRLHILDSIDPASVETLLAALDLERTGLLVISKSGGTAETLAQALIFLPALERRLGAKALAQQALAISEPGDNPLRRLAAKWRIPVLDHDPDLGGRFSVLSLVGLLPALIAGLDAAAVRRGAARVLKDTLGAAEPRDAAPALGAALQVALAEDKAVSQSVLLAYCDRLASFGLWYRQLWAESLGKGGKGTTPVPAQGTVDQHSQLQLYLDGPRDKLFTLMTLEQSTPGPCIAPPPDGDPALAYLAGRDLGTL